MGCRFRQKLMQGLGFYPQVLSPKTSDLSGSRYGLQSPQGPCQSYDSCCRILNFLGGLGFMTQLRGSCESRFVVRVESLGCWSVDFEGLGSLP